MVYAGVYGILNKVFVQLMKAHREAVIVITR